MYPSLSILAHRDTALTPRILRTLTAALLCGMAPALCAAQDAESLRLKVEHGQDAGHTWRLKDPGVYVVGRDATSAIRVLDMKVSKGHCEIQVPNGSEGGPNRSTANMSPASNGNAAAGTPNSTDRKNAGAGTIAPLPDQDQPVKRSPEDTRAYLTKAAARLDAERRANAELLAGPQRKGIRDW